MSRIRKHLMALFLLAAWAGTALSQEPKKPTGSTAGPGLQNIIAQTYSLDAEYAIDILLKITRSGRLRDKDQEKRLLIESFRRLDEVQQPVRKRLILPGIAVDNRQVRLSEAFGARLDALSFRSEILRQMFKADPKEARRMAFGTGFVPYAERPTCENALAGEFAPFYDIIAEIAKTIFSPKEVEDQVRFAALLPFVESITTVSQLIPVGKMIISLGAGKTELNQLLLAYASAIRALQPSGREFSGFLWSYDWVRDFTSVIKVCEGQGIQCSFLKDTLRGFAGKSIRSEVCPDNRLLYREQLPGLVKFLNTGLFSSAPLKADELKASSIGPPVKLDDYGTSAGASRIAREYRSLNWKDPAAGGEEYSAEEKRSNEWLEKFDRLFDEVEKWDGDEEKSPAAFFHQKCIFYMMLHGLAPAPTHQVKVLRSFGNFIVNDPIKRESRIEWFLWAENYRSLVEPGEDLKLELLENSRDPVIRLYTALSGELRSSEQPHKPGPLQKPER